MPDDPMNADLRFDRSYLRQEIWPSIERRWPGAGHFLVAYRAHMAQAQDLLDAAAAMRSDAVARRGCLVGAGAACARRGAPG
jgi:tRNA(Ile)-lysidine synthase TilS/MesJ